MLVNLSIVIRYGTSICMVSQPIHGDLQSLQTIVQYLQTLSYFQNECLI